MKNCFLFALPLLLIACNSNELDVDVSKVEVKDLIVLRLEQDLFSLNENNFETRTSELKAKYGSVFEKYLINPLKIKGLKDSLAKKSILAFTHDHDVREAYIAVQKMYPDEKVNELLMASNDCLKRFKYHFPNKKLPSKLITCTSGWNYAFAYIDDALMISLDMYLGEDSKFYQMLAYPQYQTRKMNEAHLLPDLARGWILSEFDNAEAVNTLLYHTIFYGKLYYSVKALLPNTADSLIIGYTSKQMKYCQEYEKKLWGYFAEKNRLYENDLQIVRELTGEGPFTGSIHKDCPPRIAMWVGWQIVKSYMAHNKKVTLDDLMKEKDAQKILSMSKYRP